MDGTQPVVEQLMERVRALADVVGELRGGEHLEAAVAKAADPAVWSGTPQRAFCGWLAALDGWVRNQLAGGVEAVAERIESHARELDNAQRQLAAGIPGAVCPPPPRPVGTAPGRPPEFVMQLPATPGVVSMAPEAMQDLVTILGRSKDALLDTGRRVADALTPPHVPPSAPAAVAQVGTQLGPADHLPPDGLAAVGWPASWMAVAEQLDRALQDVHARAKRWSRPGGPSDEGIRSVIASLSVAFGGIHGPPRPAPAAGPPAPTRGPRLGPPVPPRVPAPSVAPSPPRSPDDLGREARRLVEARQGLSKGERQSLRTLLGEAQTHADDPQWCTAFVTNLGEDGIRRLIGEGAVASKSYERRQILGRLATVFNAAAASPSCDQHLVDGILSGATWRLDLFVAHGRWSPELTARAALPLVTAAVGPGDLWRDAGRSVRAGLRLLQRDPETAQAFIRSHPDRMAGLLALDGPLGQQAAGVFTLAASGAAKEAEDALEAVIRQVAAGKPLGHPGAIAVAGQLAPRMALVAEQAVKGPGEHLPSSAPGFNVEPDDLRRCLGSVLADKDARSQIVTGTAVYVAQQFQAGAADVAAAVTADRDSPQDALIDSATNVERLNHLLGDAMNDLEKRRERDQKVLVQIIGGAAQLVGMVLPAENAAGKLTVAVVKEAASKKGAAYAAEAKAGDVSAYGDYYSLRDLIAASLYEQDAIREGLHIPPPPGVRTDADGRPHLSVPPPGEKGRQAYLGWLQSRENRQFRDLVASSVEKFVPKPSG